MCENIINKNALTDAVSRVNVIIYYGTRIIVVVLRDLYLQW